MYLFHFRVYVNASCLQEYLEYSKYCETTNKSPQKIDKKTILNILISIFTPLPPNAMYSPFNISFIKKMKKKICFGAKCLKKHFNKHYRSYLLTSVAALGIIKAVVF